MLPAISPVHIRSRPIFCAATIGPTTRPSANASPSSSVRLLRADDIRIAIGVKNNSAAESSGGSRAASTKPIAPPMIAPDISPMPSPL